MLNSSLHTMSSSAVNLICVLSDEDILKTVYSERI